MTGPVFVEVAPSHTKGRDVFLMVSAEFLGPGDRVLVVDDFLASGATIAALARLVAHAGATLVGIGAAIATYLKCKGCGNQGLVALFGTDPASGNSLCAACEGYNDVPG